MKMPLPALESNWFTYYFRITSDVCNKSFGKIFRIIFFPIKNKAITIPLDMANLSSFPYSLTIHLC
jgi:hypothetical protein